MTYSAVVQPGLCQSDLVRNSEDRFFHDTA